MANAVHITQPAPGGKSTHAVGLGDLRVLIICEGEGEWYAQGLEIDYLAQGTSLDDVRKSFEQGLVHTVDAHLETHGDLRHLLKPAPESVWAEFYTLAPDEYRYSQITVHQLSKPSADSITIAKYHTGSKAKAKAKAPKVLPKQGRKAPTTLPFDRILYLDQCA